jgi:hypothetical protein
MRNLVLRVTISIFHVSLLARDLSGFFFFLERSRDCKFFSAYEEQLKTLGARGDSERLFRKEEPASG